MKNLFRLPTPKELGKSDHNALPIDFFDDAGQYTWERYKEEIKQKYPIRNFLFNTLTMWFRVHIIMNISHAWYWLRCHTYNKYHLLDIRQPHNEGSRDNYKWGWVDECNQILLANFSILTQHLEIRNNSEYHYSATPEGAQKLYDSYKNDPNGWDGSEQAAELIELYTLNKYWTIDRKIADKENQQLLTEWHDARKNKQNDAEEKWNKLQLSDAQFKQTEEDMLIRLIKIRDRLWT